MDQQFEEECHQHITDINAALSKFKNNPTPNQESKLKHQLDIYLLTLERSNAPKEKYKFVQDQKKEIQSIKMKKINEAKKNTPIKDPSKKSEDFQQAIAVVGNLKKEADERLKTVDRSLEQMKSISNQIQLELNRQIEKLDEVHEQMIEFDTRWARVKQGMLGILRRAMFDKFTRLLALLLILAIIGLIVVYILQSKGIINPITTPSHDLTPSNAHSSSPPNDQMECK